MAVLNRWRLAIGAMMSVTGLALSTMPVAAAEIKVLTAGAFKPVVTAIAADFEKQTGHKLVIDNDTAGALVKRINSGEAFDLVVLTPGALEPLAKDSKVVGGSVQRLARRSAAGYQQRRCLQERPARRARGRLHRPGGRRIQWHLSVAMVREGGHR